MKRGNKSVQISPVRRKTGIWYFCQGQSERQIRFTGAKAEQKVDLFNLKEQAKPGLFFFLLAFMENGSGDGAEALPGLIFVHGCVSCSVCLEPVTDAGQRSIAKLKCGHYFHLDCIGSAFNAKGAMQCPNCRHVEDGQWLYANGCSSHEDIPFEDVVYDDDYDIYGGVSDLIFGHEHIAPINWCPYQGSYPQFSVSLEEVEPSANGYSDVIVNVVYGDVSTTCPFAPANEARTSRHQHMYDPTIGAVQYMPNQSLGAETAGPQSFTSPDGRHWDYSPIATMSGSASFDDPGSTRIMPVNERGLPYRIPADMGVQHRAADAATIWAEPYARGQVHSGTGLLPPTGSLRTGSGTYSRRWRNRGPGVVGRAGQPTNSNAQLDWGIVTSAGEQDMGITSTPDTNWQGDQGIPWRRDGFSVYPWVVSDSESNRWTSIESAGWSPFHQPAAVASSSSHNNYGAHGLGNGGFRAFPGYSSHFSFQHDGPGDIGSMHPHSSMRPTR